MLPEMRYIETELLPMLRERADKHARSAQRQLRQWKGEAGICSLLLSVSDLPEAARLPEYNLDEIHFDDEKMLVHQLRGALTAALADGDAVPSVRANVGCGALCTLLGGLKQNFYPDKMPWLQQRLTAEQIMHMTAEDITESPEFQRGLAQMRYMKDFLVGTGIEVYPMDLQGPIDVAHLLLGDRFFYDLYDEPELVHKALQLAVEVDTFGMKKCLEIINPTDHVAHYNGLVLPKETPLKVSEDTSTLLSKNHLQEYMVPYTTELLRRFGGGYIHYCGDNRHLLAMVPELENAIGLNFGNPERHDPETVLKALRRKKMCYYGALSIPWQEQLALSRGEDGVYNSFISVSCRADEQADLIGRFREQCHES